MQNISARERPGTRFGPPDRRGAVFAAKLGLDDQGTHELLTKRCEV
jgi:hypothetical protein